MVFPYPLIPHACVVTSTVSLSPDAFTMVKLVVGATAIPMKRKIIPTAKIFFISFSSPLGYHKVLELDANQTETMGYQ